MYVRIDFDIYHMISSTKIVYSMYINCVFSELGQMVWLICKVSVNIRTSVHNNASVVRASIELCSFVDLFANKNGDWRKLAVIWVLNTQKRNGSCNIDSYPNPSNWRKWFRSPLNIHRNLIRNTYIKNLQIYKISFYVFPLIFKIIQN